MKRLLTYLSAIVIMMMVPIGAQAWNDIQMIADFSGSEQTYGASGVSGNDATIIVDASSLTHGTSYKFKIKSSNDGGTYWGWNYTFDMTSNSKVTNIYASDNNDYFKIKHDSKYLKYRFTFNYTNQSDNGAWKWKITVEGVSATLTIDDNDITGTNSGSNYFFSIPDGSYTAGSTMTFTLKTETGGTATYYTGNFPGTASGDAFTYSTSSSSATMSYSVPSTATGPITVSLLTGSNEVVFAYSESGGGGGTTTEKSYYLVGNFFNTDDGTNINYNNRYFKFNKQSDGSYMVEIPATVTANTQILCVEGSTTSIYGPGQAAYGLHAADGTAVGWPATDGNVTGNLTKSTTLALNNNYWKLTTRNNNTSAGDDDGLYEVSFTLNSSGVPSNWTIKHVSTKRVVYFLSTATGAVATPLYDKRNDANAAYTNATKGYLHFDASNQYWVLSNIVYKDIIEDTGDYYCGTNLGAHKNNRNRDILPTTNKLIYKGNGNRVFATDKYGNEVSPNEQAIAANYLNNNQNATYEVQYNPSNGDGDLAKSHWGMRGQIQFLGGTSADDHIKSVSMVGPAIPGTTSGTTWDWASTAGDMTWDVTENCYKLTLTTTAPAGEHFRFVANHAQAKNFYETNTTARIPYDGTATSGTSAATEEDPNDVAYTTSGTTSYTESSYDILFNRPAGEWTVRFYLTYDKDQNKSFYYTITGTENTDPDATLSPGTDGGNYDFDNYTTGTAETETLDVTLSNATKYAYAIGANSSVTLDENTTYTDASLTLTFDGTKVTDGFGNVVTGKTVYVKIQGQDASDNKGTTHIYQYTFNVSGGSTLDFTPKGGLFINSAKITVTGGTAPYTYTVKDASGNVRSTGYFVLDDNVDDDNYRISTPGYLTVTDANGNTATSDKAFDFTYSTSENYKNYNYNATGSKIIQTGGGQGALNVFINKNDDLGTLWLYAYNKTLDTELKDQHKDQDEIDKQVRLTDAFPGNDMTKAPTITIDGIKYVHFTIPEGNLRTNDKVAIIVSQGNTQAENWWTQTTDAGVEIARTEDPAFIYNVKNVPATTADDSWNYKGANQLYQIAADGSRTIFFTKPDGWTEPIYCHAEDPSKPYCYFVDTNSWGSNLRIWAWDANNGNKNYTGGEWPGATMTQVGDNGASGDSKRYVYRWEYSGDETGKPNKVKFSNNGSSETGSFDFINGAIYNTSGLVKGNEKPTSDKMVLKEGNIYTFSVPVGSTKLYFYDANGTNKTSVETYSSSARNHYTWDGSTLSSTTATYAADLTELTTFLNTPPTTTVVTQKYPNGEDYWRAAPGDLSIKLDPTWGGKTLGDENSVVDWTGTAVPKRINTTDMPLTQTIQGLNAGKTYTVQAIVRGLGENKKTVTLTLEGAEPVTKTINLRNGSGGEAGSVEAANLSRKGNVVNKYGRIEYIEPLNLAGMNKYTGEKAGGWAKVEATVNASQAGWLTISLTGDEWFDLSQVTLLEDANTDHGFRTTASTSATDTSIDNVDFRDRSWKKNNAFSFFDRGKNRNAVVFADKRTVIAMDKSLLAPECPNRDIDRRHPFNVVATNGATDTNGEASVLYLTDMGYGGDTDYSGDADNPVDYDQTGNITGYSRSGYTFMPTLQFTASKVVMDRPIGNETKRQTTIMLPFAISQSELQTYYSNALEVWSYASYNTDERKIVFTKLTGDLEANTPYILTGAGNPTTSGTAILDSRNNASSAAKTIPAVTETTYAEAENYSGFTGTYEFQTIQRGDANETHYGFNPSTGKFQIVSYKGAALKPFRAYFTLPLPYEEQTSAPAYTVVFDDTITGISDTIQVEVEPTDVYTLGGVRVATKGDLSRLPKGVYIVNGKKVIK